MKLLKLLPALCLGLGLGFGIASPGLAQVIDDQLQRPINPP